MTPAELVGAKGDRIGTNHPLTPERVRQAAAVATGLAGAIHYLVVPAHRAEWWVAAVLFTLIGGAQLAWAVLAWRTTGRRLLLAGAAVNLTALAVWFDSRIWGLPVGPQARAPEAVGVADLVCAVAEAVAVAAVVLVVLTRPAQQRRESLN